jgi:D-serine deaminase-like pyridoxal phosphate-dependent protein
MGLFADTARLLERLPLDAPALLVDETRARANIAAMCAKVKASNISLRPHFKTHQNVGVGRWFREAGIRQATVSSYDMAVQFADDGWDNLLIAMLVDPGDLTRLAALGRRLTERNGRLGLLVDTPEAARAVASAVEWPNAIHMKIDTGYGRSGIDWEDVPRVRETAAAADFTGLVTHAGHSYRTPLDELKALHCTTAGRLHAVAVVTGQDLLLSVGDTPTCATVDLLVGVDEVRPGNFVFFDVMQLVAGVCGPQQLALAAACPVLAVDEARGRLVLRGGAVHLGKDPALVGGAPIYGCLGTLVEDGFDQVLPEVVVTQLTQEHAVVEVPRERWDDLAAGLRPGDLALVFPSHSCLACHQHGHLRTTAGAYLPREADGSPGS